MSDSGLCQVCERAQAQHQCERCGALVCQEHFVRSQGLCVECARGSSLEDHLRGH